MDSYPQLAAAVARVERLRWQYAAAVFCRGVLAGLLAVWCAVDLGIAATLAVEEAALVAPLVRASIGVMAVLIAIYMVAIPLVRRFPVMRFVRYLDFLAGGDEHLLTALEVRQELSRGGGDRLSAALVAQVGERAFRRVSALSWTGLPAARRLYLLAVCFLALTAGGLTAILAFPEVVGPAVVLFVASDPEQREAVWRRPGSRPPGGLRCGVAAGWDAPR